MIDYDREDRLAVGDFPINLGTFPVERDTPCVYVIFGAGEFEVLYVGLSINVARRLHEHQKLAAERGYAAWAVNVFDTTEEARYFEAVGIDKMRPRHNKRLERIPRRPW